MYAIITHADFNSSGMLLKIQRYNDDGTTFASPTSSIILNSSLGASPTTALIRSLALPAVQAFDPNVTSVIWGNDMVLPTPSTGMDLYLDGAKVSKPGVATRAGTVASGNIVVHFTDNNASGGNAIFSNIKVDSIQVQFVKTSGQLISGTPVVSNANKTVTIPIYQRVDVIGLLPSFPAASNGEIAKVTVFGTLV